MKRITRYCLLGTLFAGFLASCNTPEELSQTSETGRVRFQGLVKNSSLTRSDFNEEDFVLINSSSDAMFGEISICRSLASTGDTQAEYVSADGMEGRLSPISTPLTWQGRDTEHTFYAWTHPAVGEGTVTGGVEMDAAIRSVGRVTFGIQKDTGLEQFIAAKEGPVTYDENGLYVKLLFYRPVAKIQIESVTHVSSSGSLTPVEKCSIYFPNLYATARFDAKKERPQDGNQGNIWLTEGDPGYEIPTTGLVWEWDISNPDVPLGDHVLYVHPFEFGTDNADGSQPDETQPGYFTITTEINDTEKVYYASLAGLVDVKELQAGQFMKMQISIQDGGSGGLGCRIEEWDTNPEESIEHRRAGIYTQADAEALLALLQSDPVDEEALAAYCREGHTIYLYNHLDWSEVTEPVKIPDGYTLDGQGYYARLGDGGTLSGTITNLFTPEGDPWPDPDESGSGGGD